MCLPLQTRLWSLDYAGITVLIVTSFIPPIFYGFLCHPLARNFYLYSTLSLGELGLLRPHQKRSKEGAANNAHPEGSLCDDLAITNMLCFR